MSAEEERKAEVEQPLLPALPTAAADNATAAMPAPDGKEEAAALPLPGPSPELRQKLVLLKIATRKRQLLDLQRRVAQRVVDLANQHNAPYKPPPPPPPPPPPLPPPPAHQLFDHKQFFVRRSRAALSFSIPSILPVLPPISLVPVKLPSAAELLARMPHAYLPSTLAAASAGATTATTATTSAAKAKREVDVMEQARKHQQRVAEQAEQRLKKEKEKQRKLLRKHFLTILLKQHREAFITFHRSRTKQQTALARAAVKGVEGLERKKKAAEEKSKKDRMKALKENDMHSYLSLLEGHKNDRLTALLHQTDGYLKELGRMMRGGAREAEGDDEVRRPRPYLGKGRRQRDADALELPVNQDGLTWADRQAVLRRRKQTDGEMKTEEEDGEDEQRVEKEEKMDIETNGEKEEEEKEAEHMLDGDDAMDDDKQRASPSPPPDVRSPDDLLSLNIRRERIVEQPRLLSGGTLKNYQLTGLEWMVGLYNSGMNGILADEMGLGKTVQTISLFAYLMERKHNQGPFLCVVPLSTLNNWLTEFTRFAPDIKCLVYQGNRPTRHHLWNTQVARGEFHVLLTTYEYVINRKDIPRLASIDWQYICVAAGTLVSCGDGVSRPIEQISADDEVLAFDRRADGVVKRLVSVARSTGVRECVELSFLDGRRLLCTPDHRILTYDRRWVQASHLRSSDRVCAGLDLPVTAVTPADLTWRLDTRADLGFALDMTSRRAETMAFSRLMGLQLSSAGVIAELDNERQRAGVSVRSMLDAASVQCDVHLLTGQQIPYYSQQTPNSRVFVLTLPPSLTSSFCSAGAVLGRRSPCALPNTDSWPAFLFDAECPLAIVVEFLGGLFGGDGDAPALVDSGMELSGITLSKRIVGCLTRDVRRQLTSDMSKLLQRCGISSASITSHLLDQPDSHTKPDAARIVVREEEIDTTLVYSVLMELAEGDTLSFHERIGFRYCADKQLRLTVAAACCRAKASVDAQYVSISRRSLQLMDGEHMTIQSAAVQAKAELATSEALWPDVMRWRPHDRSELEQLTLTSSPTPFVSSTRKLLDQFDAYRFFRPSSPADTMLHTDSHTDASIPIFSVPLVAVRPAGRKPVYDITVPGDSRYDDHSFLANGLVVHNCVDEGHRMKNAESKLTTILSSRYSSRHRLILTGTPLQNSLRELWSLLNFLLPKIFNSGDNFEDWFNKPFESAGMDRTELDEEEKLLIIHRLHQVLRPFLLRRLKSEVADQLPEKKESVLKCQLSAWQLTMYNQIKSRALGMVDRRTGELRPAKLSNTLMQLRKICNHPYLVSHTTTTHSASSALPPCGCVALTACVLRGCAFAALLCSSSSIWVWIGTVRRWTWR